MSEKITKSARFTPEWAARIDLMAALDVEMPDGVTSVLQEGAEMAWAKYGRLAEVMADAKARAREEPEFKPYVDAQGNEHAEY